VPGRRVDEGVTVNRGGLVRCYDERSIRFAREAAGCAGKAVLSTRSILPCRGHDQLLCVPTRAEFFASGFPGQSVQIDQRWTGGFDFGTLRAAAKELVSLRPDVIISRSTAATAALLYETRTRPVVFLLISDPIGDGNATGFTDIPARWQRR
jgi:hypothetical protein